jgi:hypothetical protein
MLDFDGNPENYQVNRERREADVLRRTHYVIGAVRRLLSITQFSLCKHCIRIRLFIFLHEFITTWALRQFYAMAEHLAETRARSLPPSQN